MPEKQESGGGSGAPSGKYGRHTFRKESRNQQDRECPKATMGEEDEEQKEDEYMEPTYESITEWLDGYFMGVSENQGPIETVRNLRDYFTSDFEFLMYTARSPNLRLSRDELMVLFVHPGLHERLSPNYYAIDVKQLIAVVQFEVQFTDQSSGTTWPPMQASAHYHLTADENKNLKIRKIQYWAQTFSPDVYGSMFQAWEASRQKALADLAKEYLNTKR
jgi:hypothetical protein